MSLLSPYLNQTVKWSSFIRTDDVYSSNVFAPPVPIRVRNQAKCELYKTDRGDTKTSTSVLYTEAPVKAGDLINDSIVGAVNAMVSLEGNIIGYKVLI
jgi:hypothetical protein